MNTKSIYTIHENEKEFCFSSDYAGGFSYPFLVADFLRMIRYGLSQSFAQKGLCAAPMLSQMTGDYHFPDELEGRELFQVISTEKAYTMLLNDDISFEIDIDLDNKVINYHFHINDSDLCDATVPIYGEFSEHGGKEFSNMLNSYMMSDMLHENNTPLWELAEQAAKMMIEKAVDEQQAIGCPQMG